MRAFVSEGGGYIGTCGGAFLAMTHLHLYGENVTTVEPWARGQYESYESQRTVFVVVLYRRSAVSVEILCTSITLFGDLCVFIKVFIYAC